MNAKRFAGAISLALCGLPAHWASAGAPPGSTTLLALNTSELNLFQSDTDATEAASAEESEVNTGQDPTKPLARLDLRYKHQALAGDHHAEIFTFRVDKPFALGGGWALSTRLDLPLVFNDVSSLDNPDSDDELGFSDSLFQALLITPPLDREKRWAAAFGTQVLFPTGSEDQFGTGKWQLAPTVALRAGLPEISKGSFFALLIRDQFSVAGQDDRRDIHDLIVQPVFNWQLPDLWFVTVAPEMKFDLENDGDAFIPFDILIGKMLTQSVVASIQVDVPMVDDYEQYEWQVEFRLGFFF